MEFTKINTYFPTKATGNPSAHPRFQPPSHYSSISGRAGISWLKTEARE